MATEEQVEAFEAHENRLGVAGVCAALGFRGGDGYGVDDAENLAVAFCELTEADAAQALRVLAMAR